MEYVDGVKVFDPEVEGMGYPFFRKAQSSSCDGTHNVSDCNVEQQSLVYCAMINCRLYLKMK